MRMSEELTPKIIHSYTPARFRSRGKILGEMEKSVLLKTTQAIPVGLNPEVDDDDGNDSIVLDVVFYNNY